MFFTNGGAIGSTNGTIGAIGCRNCSGFFGHQWQPMAPIAKLPVVPSIWQNTERSQCCIASETLLVVKTGIPETIIFFFFCLILNQIKKVFFMLCWDVVSTESRPCAMSSCGRESGGRTCTSHPHHSVNRPVN